MLFDTQDNTQELQKTNLSTTFHFRFSTSETEVFGSTEERLVLTFSATPKTNVCKNNIHIKTSKMSKFEIETKSILTNINSYYGQDDIPFNIHAISVSLCCIVMK